VGAFFLLDEANTEDEFKSFDTCIYLFLYDDRQVFPSPLHMPQAVLLKVVVVVVVVVVVDCRCHLWRYQLLAFIRAVFPSVDHKWDD